MPNFRECGCRVDVRDLKMCKILTNSWQIINFLHHQQQFMQADHTSISADYTTYVCVVIFVVWWLYSIQVELVDFVVDGSKNHQPNQNHKHSFPSSFPSLQTKLIDYITSCYCMVHAVASSPCSSDDGNDIGGCLTCLYWFVFFSVESNRSQSAVASR